MGSWHSLLVISTFTVLSLCAAGALGDFGADKIILKLNTLAQMPHPTRARKLVKCPDMPWGKLIDRRTSNTFQISEACLQLAWLTLKQNPASKKTITGCRVRAVLRALAFPQCGPGSIPTLAAYVGWVCCWFSTLLREVLGTPGFALSLKSRISKFQFHLHSKDKSKYFFM